MAQDDTFSHLAWLPPNQNSFGVRVLDCRPFSTTMIAVTTDENETVVVSHTVAEFVRATVAKYRLKLTDVRDRQFLALAPCRALPTGPQPLRSCVRRHSAEAVNSAHESLDIWVHRHAALQLAVHAS
jgi:hypothetical protein